MARNQPRSVFGVHGVTAYSRTTGIPYGELQIVKSSSISLEAELVDLMGGSSKYPWASEEGAISSEMTLNVGEIPNFIFTLFLGATPTLDADGETSGNVSTLTNKNGSTVQHATNGIASVFLLAGSSANLKFGKYVVEAVGTAIFNVYYNSSIDAGRGTDITFLDDTLMVASSVAFTASVASVPALGLSWAQIGTPAFTTGDTATFEVRPVSTQLSTVTIGGLANQSFPEWGALVYGQKRGNGEMFEIDCFRCKSAGAPLPFEMGQFAAYELKVKLLYDSARDGLFSMRHVDT
jgi:hypothetical protein